MVLRVGYIREHFASPILQFAEADGGKTFKLVECPGGTGQIIAAFKNDEIDVGIALTDALIAGIANGNPDYRLVGQYVTTPLNWAVIVGHDSTYQKIEDLKGTTMGISRIGSGSQVMAAVMAMQQGWYSDQDRKVVEKFNFKVNNNIDGLIRSVNDGSTSAFMWEWFTTKPYADKKQVRFIGSVPTPWPSWMIAAHTSVTRAPSADVRDFLSSLTAYVKSFSEGLVQSVPVGVEIMGVSASPTFTKEQHGKEGSDEIVVVEAPMLEKERANVEYIVRNFGYPEEDVKEWMSTVGYPVDVGVVPFQVVVQTLDVLEQAGVVNRPEQGFEPSTFAMGNICRFE
ncbi:hypothetical protein CPB86DRAFT_778610 [Serendipita vermifera]|nr:hypothetical protein CPB86DRAFT_778610 [Serendipita vermifera]